MPLSKSARQDVASRQSASRPPWWRVGLLMAVLLLGGLFVLPPSLFQKNVATEEFAADPPLEVVTLQLKWQHQFQFAGYYAAKAQGFYEEAGLDVRIVEST